MMEEIARSLAHSMANAVEIIAAIVIGIALIQLTISYFRSITSGNRHLNQEKLRIKFGGSVAVALELLLGADVLKTAVAPTWDDIGKLAAIAILRTALNYFLERDLRKLGREPLPENTEYKSDS